MAKIKLSSSNTEGFSGDADFAVNGAQTRATLNYSDEGQIKFFGEGFKENAEGVLKAGTVEKIVFFNSLGDETITVTGKYNAAEIAGTVNAESIFFSLFDGKDVVTGSKFDDNLTIGERGNDKIFGKGGDDDIDGGRGNDILSGGSGADEFEFSSGDGIGQDVITDFDVTGADADFLTLSNLTIENIGKTGGGDDTKLTLDNGATIVLKDVTKAEFETYWETHAPPQEL